MNRIGSKFLKAPLTAEEKAKKAEDFLNFYDSGPSGERKEEVDGRVLKREEVKRITVRFPQSLADNVTEIAVITGISVNAVLIELLRDTAREKLQEIKSK